MNRFAIRDNIDQLDPRADCERIVFLSSRFDFPFDTTRALELALFRTFAVPRISAMLDRTGEFGQRAQKRYDDTDILVSNLMERGFTSDAGQRAVRRMNELHGRFAIANDDFLYVLSTFVFEPIRWNERFGWRRMTERERLAYFYFWREVGVRMGIEDIPESYDEFEAFNREFERTRFKLAASNGRVGAATREMMVAWFPRPLAPVVRSAVHALLDDPLREAFGFPKSAWPMRLAAPAALRLRARVIRWLPPRRRPMLRTKLRRRLYPEGWVIEELGPAEGSGFGVQHSGGMAPIGDPQT